MTGYPPGAATGRAAPTSSVEGMPGPVPAQRGALRCRPPSGACHSRPMSDSILESPLSDDEAAVLLALMSPDHQHPMDKALEPIAKRAGLSQSGARKALGLLAS